MNGRLFVRFTRLVLVTFTALTWLSTRAEAGPIRYTVTDLGLLLRSPDTPSHPLDTQDDLASVSFQTPRIDNSGRIYYGNLEDSDGRYQTGSFTRDGKSIATRVSDGVSQELVGFARAGENYTWASGVNAAGWVVGWSGHPTGGLEYGTGFIVGPWDSRVEAALSPTEYPNDFSRVYDINNQNQFVGTASVVSDIRATRAFISTVEEETLNLNDLIDPAGGWTVTVATGINDLGQIVGIGRDPSGSIHRLLLSPNAVPEPSILMLFGAVAAALGVQRVGRRTLS